MPDLVVLTLEVAIELMCSFKKSVVISYFRYLRIRRLGAELFNSVHIFQNLILRQENRFFFVKLGYYLI